MAQKKEKITLVLSESNTMAVEVYPRFAERNVSLAPSKSRWHPGLKSFKGGAQFKGLIFQPKIWPLSKGFLTSISPTVQERSDRQGTVKIKAETTKREAETIFERFWPERKIEVKKFLHFNRVKNNRWVLWSRTWRNYFCTLRSEMLALVEGNSGWCQTLEVEIKTWALWCLAQNWRRGGASWVTKKALSTAQPACICEMTLWS